MKNYMIVSGHSIIDHLISYLKDESTVVIIKLLAILMTMQKRNDKKRLFIIDGNSYIYRAFYAIRNLSTSKGLPVMQSSDLRTCS